MLMMLVNIIRGVHGKVWREHWKVCPSTVPSQRSRSVSFMNEPDRSLPPLPIRPKEYA